MGKLERMARQQDNAAGLSRRNFLLTASTTGFIFGFARGATAREVYPLAQAQVETAAEAANTLFEPTIWCGIGPDGMVNVNIIRAEMGQHVGTSLARILADELDADWDKVTITQVDTAPKWGMMVTGGSWSVWMTWDTFRQAGAAARKVMLDEGAKILGATPDDCTVSKGMVSANGKSVSYGDIVAQAKPTRTFTPDEMKALPLKAAADYTMIGKPVAALDIPSKTTGAARYGIDVKLDGMVYARPKMPPTRYGSVVTHVDESEAKKVPGYQRHIIIKDASENVQGWVVAIADTYPAAIRAADKLNVTWTPGPQHATTEADILNHARTLIADAKKGTMIWDDKGTDDALDQAATRIEAEYTCASVAHYTLEPMNAVARQNSDGIWEIHTGNQWQSLFLPSIAKALGVGEDKVVMETYLLGGGFGRRLNGDYAIPAALASQALGGKPVKLILTRTDDMLFDSFRSPSVQHCAMGLDHDGKPTAYVQAACAGWPTQVMAAAAMAKGVDGKPYDQFAISGADHWYDTGPTRIRALSNDLANKTFRPGWLRSVSAGWTPWALESFMDEAAHKAGKDPVAFRLALFTATGRNAGSAPNAVGGAKRQAHVVQRVADVSGYGKVQFPPDTALGIATTYGQERGMPTWTAAAAQVHVSRETGVVTCQKLWLVLDAGTIVDPDGALAQTEGGALWGLSMALFEGTEIRNGNLMASNLDTYTPARIADVPDIEIEFVPSTEKPMGLGEPGVTAIAPAIGNAIFNAVGVRLRHIPIRPQAVLAALKDKKTP